ncbi:MAG: response regulator [Planctomycetes bacterium]|nr:response regulator [Planctomycetota bacterium]
MNADHGDGERAGHGEAPRRGAPVVAGEAGGAPAPAPPGQDPAPDRPGPRLDFNDPYTLTGHRVLVVDDDPLIAKVITAGLKKHHYVVETAATGYEAGFLTVDFSPDVVLLDLNLPDINGDIVCRRIRESEHTRGLKVIGMSASGDQKRIKAMFDAGINEFVPKPFSIERLREAIVQQAGPIRRRPAEPATGWRAWVALAALGQLLLAAAYVVAFTKQWNFFERRSESVGYVAGVGWVDRKEMEKIDAERKMTGFGSVPDPLTGSWIGYGQYEENLRRGLYDHVGSDQVARDLRMRDQGMRLAGPGQWISGRAYLERQLQRNLTDAAKARSVRDRGGFRLNGVEAGWLEEENRFRAESPARRFFEGRWLVAADLTEYAKVTDAKTNAASEGFVSRLPDGRVRVITARGEDYLPGGSSRIEPAATRWTDYWNREAGLSMRPGNAEDRAAHLALAEWCRDAGLAEAARRHWRITLIIDRDNAAARAALGHRRAPEGDWRASAGE